MIGLLGGTFDPVHFGHLRPALEVCQALALRELRFLPCGLPPHREAPQALPEQRLTMLRLAITGQSEFCVDVRELQREGPSYMVDTLYSLREEQGTTPLCLILGMDAFSALDSWSRWEQLIELAHLVVTHRPGWTQQVTTGRAAVQQLVSQRRVMQAEALRTQPAGCIYFQTVTQLAIAATDIRKMLYAGKDVRYLLPDSVYEWIKKEGIYRA